MKAGQSVCRCDNLYLFCSQFGKRAQISELQANIRICSFFVSSDVRYRSRRLSRRTCRRQARRFDRAIAALPAPLRRSHDVARCHYRSRYRQRDIRQECWPSAAPISTGAARCPAPSCRAPPIPARCARMSAAASSMRCATPCGAASTASLLSVRGGDAAGETVARRHRRGRHRRSFGGVPRPRDAELHGAARPRRRGDRRRLPTWGSTSWPSPSRSAAPRCARRSRRPMPMLCDANLPAAALAAAGGARRPASRSSPSPSRRPRRCGLPACSAGLSCLFMNRREAARAGRRWPDANRCRASSRTGCATRASAAA